MISIFRKIALCLIVTNVASCSILGNKPQIAPEALTLVSANILVWLTDLEFTDTEFFELVKSYSTPAFINAMDLAIRQASHDYALKKEITGAWDMPDGFQFEKLVDIDNHIIAEGTLTWSDDTNYPGDERKIRLDFVQTELAGYLLQAIEVELRGEFRRFPAGN